jgi:predicted DNA-binding transcriptional regulator YafY
LAQALSAGTFSSGGLMPLQRPVGVPAEVAVMMSRKPEERRTMEPRHQKAENLLRLALAMQSSAEGLSLEDMQQVIVERTGGEAVSRRTAERMRDAILRVFPQTEELADGRGKRWRIPSRTLSPLVSVSAEELASLNTAIELLRRDGVPGQAAQLTSLADKLRAALRAEALRRIEAGYEELLAAEGLAMRPGPCPKIEAALLPALREAILAREEIHIHYRARTTGKRTWQTVHPYGILYGSRHYLVAFKPEHRQSVRAADDRRLLSAWRRGKRPRHQGGNRAGERRDQDRLEHGWTPRPHRCDWQARAWAVRAALRRSRHRSFRGAAACAACAAVDVRAGEIRGSAEAPWGFRRRVLLDAALERSQ